MHNGSNRLVAVVDDDDAVRDSLRFLLEIAGHSVATYASAAQFLLEAPIAELTCLVVDQHMPDQTGLQLVSRLRALGVTLPVAARFSSLGTAGEPGTVRLTLTPSHYRTVALKLKAGATAG